MPIPTFNHDNEYVNKYDNKFETKKVNWTGPGFSGMTNPMPYHQIDEQPQPQQQPFPPMMKKSVNYNGPYETYGQYPMQYNNTTYTQSTYQPTYQPECPLPSHAGWSKDFSKKHCVTPMHLERGCPPEMINCNYEYPMTKDIKWPVPQPTPQPMHVIQQVPMHVAQPSPMPMPMPVAVPMPMPVPMPIQGQWPQQQWTQQQWTQPQQQWPQGQWPQQPMWPQQQWPLQWQGQEQQPMHLNFQQPMIHPYGPTAGLRQMPFNKW